MERQDRHGTNIHALLATRRQIARTRHQPTQPASAAQPVSPPESARQSALQSPLSTSARPSARAATKTQHNKQSLTADAPPHFDQLLLLPLAPSKVGASRAPALQGTASSSARATADSKKMLNIVGQETFVLGRERLAEPGPALNQRFTGSQLDQQKATAAASAAEQALAASSSALDTEKNVDLEKWKRRRLGVLRLRLLGQSATATTAAAKSVSSGPGAAEASEGASRETHAEEEEDCEGMSSSAPTRRRLPPTRTWTAQRLTRSLATSKQQHAERALARAQGLAEPTAPGDFSAPDVLQDSLRSSMAPAAPPGKPRCTTY